MSVTSWFLVSSGGTRHRLPREMIFVGRDDCELMLQSRSVDKQHAVINYEPGTDEHKVKDLGSLNGTFVNDVRIQEQMYITLKLEDKLRFGYDTNLFTVVRGELTVPEEALKHEKFTSGLQLSKKPSNGETTTTTATSKSPTKTPTKTLKSPSGSSQRPGDSRATDGVTSSKDLPAKSVDAHKAEERSGAGDVTALPRGTPLYGQPSWWGDGDADDENSFKQETKPSSKKHDSSISDSKEARRGEKAKDDSLDSSYFEIPTKEGHIANNGIHEIPTKDTEGATAHSTTSQGHASFTIEFDNTSPGKVTIKDHVSKFTPDHHRSRSKKSGAGSGGAGGRDLSTLQAAMMASESKVADWLAQNDPTLVRSESTEEDSKSIKSDVPVHLKRLKGSKHEDGTQSDSENGLGLRFANRRHALEERLKAAHGSAGGGAGGTGGGNITVSGTRGTGSRTAFMIEFYDEENPRKRRSYSFSQTAPLTVGGAGGEGFCPQPPSHPKVFSISTSAASASDAGKAPIPATVTAGAPTAARVLLKQRSEDPSIGRSSASTGLATGSPTSPSEDASVVGKGGRTAGGEAEDDHSDKGTYTIELENRNPEEEEARRMIDKVFGVQQNQNSSILSDLKGELKGKETGETRKEAVPGDTSWVSEWASLAANHTRTDPEGSGAETAAFLHKERADTFESGASLSRGESSSSLTDRKRRTLPQLPVDDPKGKCSTKAAGLRSEIGEKQDTEPQEKENKGDGESPTPIGDIDMTSKRKQSSTSSPSKAPARTTSSTERRKRSEERKGGGNGAGEAGEKSGKPLVRQGSFTIEKPSGSVPSELIPRINRGSNGRERSDSVGSMDTATLLKDTEAVMAFLEAKLRDENKLDQKSSKTGTTAQSSGSGYPARTDSISPESDVDTNSTASHVAGEAERKGLASAEKRRSLSSMHREKSNMSTASRTSITNASARERLERKSKTRTAEATGRTDTRRSVQASAASSRARQPSLDLTDDDQTSSFPISDNFSSDQETYSGPLGQSKLENRSAKTSTGGTSKTSRTLQAATTSSLNKQASLPQPRPTRASLLRRARLGETSDTDLADADRVSVASEVSTTSSTSKPPSGRKGLSRLDMLAQPRRNRLGSISARSDSECTVTRSSTSSPRLSAETALRLGLRSSTPTENRLTPRMRANSVSKLNEAKTKTTTSGYCSPTVSSSSRWRRLPPEYGSTSEEEFGSNRNSPKHGGRSHVRPHHLVPHRSSRLSTTAGSSVVTGPGGVGVKHRMKEQEEYIRDWTAHSEEIARLFPCVRRISQDLAKDLAILAREIHDVAGEIDSVSSSGTAPSTTVSTAATTPGSAIDTREELVDRVFDESLNFRKIPPVISTSKAPEINGKPVELRPRAPDTLEPRALRRRTWNREDAVLDSLLLNSVSQLSSKIRHSIDKTAGKIRILFKDKDRNWDEIESKLRSENDVPLLKTSNKEISSILLELKRVEKQLQVINVMVDPDGTLDALASLGLTSPITPSKPITTSTAPPSVTSQGSAPQAKESLPEILPGPGGPPPRAQASPANTEAAARDSSVGLALTGVVGGLPFNRMRPSGEEAIAQK